MLSSCYCFYFISCYITDCYTHLLLYTTASLLPPICPFLYFTIFTSICYMNDLSYRKVTFFWLFFFPFWTYSTHTNWPCWSFFSKTFSSSLSTFIAFLSTYLLTCYCLLFLHSFYTTHVIYYKTLSHLCLHSSNLLVRPPFILNILYLPSPADTLPKPFSKLQTSSQ